MNFFGPFETAFSGPRPVRMAKTFADPTVFGLISVSATRRLRLKGRFMRGNNPRARTTIYPRLVFLVLACLALLCQACTGAGGREAGRDGLSPDSPAYFYDTVWRVRIPGGSPHNEYVLLKRDGSVWHHYENPERVKFDQGNAWLVENGRLVILWNRGYAREEYPIPANGAAIWKGEKSSRNFGQPKPCTIEFLKRGRK